MALGPWRFKSSPAHRGRTAGRRSGVARLLSGGERAASCAGLMLPPLATSAIRLPRSRSASFSAAASGAAPAGSTRLRVCSIISRVASRISSSLTSTKSSRCSQRICCGSSNGTRVARPSANVAVSSVDQRRGPATSGTRPVPPPTARRSPRSPAGSPSRRCTRRRRRCRRRSERRSRRRRAGLRGSRASRSDACDQERLVARVDVAVAVLLGERRAMLARGVEVPAVLDQLGAERPHRRQLDRVGVHRARRSRAVTPNRRAA